MEAKKAFLEDVKILRRDIEKILEEFGNGAFIKLNWTSAKYAQWMNPTLKCCTSDEISCGGR